MPGIAKALAAIVAGCCVAGAAGGCGSSPAGHDVATPPASASARSTQSLANPRTKILAAYAGMWKAFTAAARTADYQPGPLQPYTAGDALSVLTRGLYNNHKHGIVIRGAPVLHPHVTQMTPAASPHSARVTDCADGRHWLERSTSGRPISGAPAGYHRIYAWLRLFGTTWKVTEVVVEKAGTCG